MNVLLQSIELFKQMAKEGGITLDKTILLIEVYERHRAIENADRRSSPHEKELLHSELTKFDIAVLRNNTTREIAAQLVDNGVPIRPKVQGVLSIISRKRKQLLLQHDKSQPQAEAA